MSITEVAPVVSACAAISATIAYWLHTAIKADLAAFMEKLEKKFLDQRVYEADLVTLDARLARIDDRIGHVAR